jgi:hypothetical protein
MVAHDKKCKCGTVMTLKAVWDNAQQKEVDHAFNLYLCEDCGMIMKEDVWHDAGELWVDLTGVVG